MSSGWMSRSSISRSLTHCWNLLPFAYQPNLFKHLALQNDYQISYFKAMDHSGLYPVVIDADKTLTNTFITESLYKYNNTVNMRINVTFKKVNNDPFKFKELE
jgi:hypothetical protein